jgi:dimethylamine monooxygenase subunit C
VLAAGMISRPVYLGLSADPFAKVNLIAAEGEGADAVIEMMRAAPEGFNSKTTIVYCPRGSAGRGNEKKLEALQPDALWTLPTLQTVMFRLRGTLATATMGTRLYAAGTEPFIGSVVQVALENAIDPKSVIKEHRGSAKRRVQCVHCKGFTEDVTATPCTCAHCGLNLFVRDHYSRRLGAFQGVCVDAEIPGELPATEELYK